MGKVYVCTNFYGERYGVFDSISEIKQEYDLAHSFPLACKTHLEKTGTFSFRWGGNWIYVTMKDEDKEPYENTR